MNSYGMFVFVFFSTLWGSFVSAEVCTLRQPSPLGQEVEVVWYCQDHQSCAGMGECTDIVTGVLCLSDYQVVGQEEAQHLEADEFRNILPCIPALDAQTDGQGGGGFIDLPGQSADDQTTPVPVPDPVLHRGPYTIARAYGSWVNPDSPRDILNDVRALPLHNFCFAEIGPTREEYPPCPSGPMVRQDQNGQQIRLNNVHACKGSDSRIYSIYTCPSAYPHCSMYYGVCYETYGQQIVSCQFETLTSSHWYVPEAYCEQRFPGGMIDDLMTILSPPPVDPPTCEQTGSCDGNDQDDDDARPTGVCAAASSVEGGFLTMLTFLISLLLVARKR